MRGIPGGEGKVATPYVLIYLFDVCDVNKCPQLIMTIRQLIMLVGSYRAVFIGHRVRCFPYRLNYVHAS